MVPNLIKRSFLFLITALLAGPSFAWVEKPEFKNSEQFGGYVICRNDRVVRTIRIEKDEGSRAWVAYYTKLGVDKEVARANTLSSCHRVLENIKDNLTKANWKCKELEKVSATVAADTTEE